MAEFLKKQSIDIGSPLFVRYSYIYVSAKFHVSLLKKKYESLCRWVHQ